MNEQSAKRGIGTVGFLIAALISAGFAAYLVAMLVHDKGLKREPQTSVLVAARTISAGTKLLPTDVRVIQIPESGLPPDAVTSIAQLFGEPGTVAKVPPLAATGMVHGDFIVRSRLADSANGTAMAGRVEPGFRAIAVTVDAAVARSRLVFPGARVDIVGTFRDPKQTSSSFSRVLIDNVLVLSLEDQTDVESYRNEKGQRKERSNDAVVTVQVTPVQAEVVALAAREGRLDLALRNVNDTAVALTSGAQTEELMRSKLPGKDSEEERAAAKKESRSRRGSRSSHNRDEIPTSNPGAAIEVLGQRGGGR